MSNRDVGDVEVYKKCIELGIEKKHKTLLVLAQTLFSESIVKQIPDRAALLKKVCNIIPIVIANFIETNCCAANYN